MAIFAGGQCAGIGFRLALLILRRGVIFERSGRADPRVGALVSAELFAISPAVPKCSRSNVEAQRNVEQSVVASGEASSGSMGAAMRSASFLAGGAAGRELRTVLCTGCRPVRARVRAAIEDLDDEVLQEINAESRGERGIVPELKL